MTYREVFLSIFPRARVRPSGTPHVCREHIFGGVGTCRRMDTRCTDCWAEECPDEEGWTETHVNVAGAFLRAERAMCDRAPTCAECPLGKCSAPYTLDDAQIARIVAAVSADDVRHGGSGI